MTMNAIEHTQRQRDDRHERRAHVKQEHEAHERDDDELLDQRAREVVDGALDELRAVVGLDDFDARRQPGLSDASFALTASIVSSAFLPERMTMMPPATSPSPSSSAMPRRISGPTCTRATSPSATGTPPASTAQRNASEVVERLQVAATHGPRIPLRRARAPSRPPPGSRRASRRSPRGA